MTQTSEAMWLAREGLQSLFDSLMAEGYQLVGPTIQATAIVYDRIERVEQLPVGWTARQEAGTYRLERRDDEHYFGFTVGPHSWKQFLFPPRVAVAISERNAAGDWEHRTPEMQAPRYAFIGVRACELAAMAVQDRVFLQANYADPVYAARRQQALIVAVNCTQADPTCFCTSMNTGPRCNSGYDLALTELKDGFVVESGSERGERLLAQLTLRVAKEAELQTAEQERQHAVEQQHRTLDTTDIRNVLLRRLDHPQWKVVAERCLSCANCTQVCPTCFCSSVQDVTDLDVTRVERERVWDSCFNPDFSNMGGGTIRNTIQSRYRQWLTHKLATWIDQFDTSGCVGCGRCITWCPVGIDLTAEVAILRGDSA
jgi:ferredoxin